MTDDPPERAELAEAIGTLEDALGALREELETEHGSTGRDREPTPEELLRIADEVAVPALEATLAANRQTLAITRAAVRAAREERDDRSAARSGSGDVGGTDAREGETGRTGADGTDQGTDAGDTNAGTGADDTDAGTDDATGSESDDSTAVSVEVSTDPDADRSGGRADADRPEEQRTARGSADESGADRPANERAGDRPADLGPAISGVETALGDLQTVLEGSEPPPEGPAREVLEEARTLREEIDRRVQEATEQADRARRTRTPADATRGTDPHATGGPTADATADVGDDTDGDPNGDVDDEGQTSDASGPDSPDGETGVPDGALEDLEDPEPTVDVEAELETIKEEYARRRENLPDWATEDSDGRDGDWNDDQDGDRNDGRDGDRVGGPGRDDPDSDGGSD